MKKIVFFLSFLSLLVGRDNPFLPVKHFNSPTQQEGMKEFTSHEFNLPPNAKIIENIIINYINIDGSVQSLKLDINESFDWHDSFLVSLKKNHLKTNVAVIKPQNQNIAIKNDSQSPTSPISEQKLDQNTTKELDLVQNIEQQPQNDEMIEQEEWNNADLFGLAKIRYGTKKFILTSEHKLLRYFSLPNPERIVFDFQKTINHKPKTLILKDSYLTRVTLGAHSGFYRFVFYPDAKYKIDVSTNRNDIEVTIE